VILQVTLILPAGTGHKAPSLAPLARVALLLALSCSKPPAGSHANPARSVGTAVSTFASATATSAVVPAAAAGDTNADATAPADANLTDAAAEAGAPPRNLRCLVATYGGEITRDAKGFALRMGSKEFAYADGRVRSDDDRFEEPDLSGIFSVPYKQKAIGPVTDTNEDPGRIRHEPLLRAYYGDGQYAIERELVAFPFFDQALRVHRKALPAFERVRARLEQLLAADAALGKYFQHIGGTYNYRKIAGSYRTSAHAFGIAIDLSVAYSHYWRNERGLPQWKNLIPASVVEAFEAEQFVWGGRWYHYDTMHFEYRPEFFRPECVQH
jgi:hypothetical protein